MELLVMAAVGIAAAMGAHWILRRWAEARARGRVERILRRLDGRGNHGR